MVLGDTTKGSNGSGKLLATKASTADTYTIAGGTGAGALIVSPTSGSIPLGKGLSQALTFDWDWTQLSASNLGTVTGTVTASASHSTAFVTVTADILENRQLTVDSTKLTGSLTNPIRIMQKTGVLTATLEDQSGLSDSQGTRVDVVQKGKATDKNATVSYGAAGASDVFNGSLVSEPLNVTFAGSGLSSGTLDVAPKMLKNGEGKTVGAADKTAVLSYTDVAVLQQTQLKVGKLTPTTMNNGFVVNSKGVVVLDNVLAGGYAPVVALTSGNKVTGDDYLTRVDVGGAAVGPLTVAPTLITGGAATTIYGQVTAADTTGTITSKTKPTSVPVDLKVTTAEASSVGDTKPYKDVTSKPSYEVGTVGNAALGPSGTLGPQLSGFVPQGFTLGSFAAGSTGNVSLSSKVVSIGSSNSNGLGSQAQILTSTRVAADTLITMAWRQRTAYESGQSSTPAATDAILPSGIKFLTSDVVSTSINSPLVYAMQMSFSPAVIAAMDHNNTPLGEFNANSLYLGQIVGASSTSPGVWQNAVLSDAYVGKNAQQDINESLATFLNSKLAGLTGSAADAELQSLLGSWGVDTTNNQAWAIIDHAGTMAVVPEPASLMLLISAGLGLVLYRRWRR
jgi:hypothetical protein